MPIQAFLLVVLAALAHCTWNILLKRATASQHLLFFSSLMEALLFLPMALYGMAESWPILNAKSAALLGATGILHLLYSESLLRGYRSSDFSVVYPLARGAGPLLSFFGAILLLHERLTWLSAGGALFITLGVLLSSGGISALRNRLGQAGLFWGCATGVTIAGYTLVDGYSVKVFLVSPLLVEYAGNALRALALSTAAIRHGQASLTAEYRKYWKSAWGIAVLMPVGYILVLFAMRTAPVSHVAPLREMSMLIGAYFGVKFLHEGHARSRLFGAAFIAAGVAALAAS